jgi:hypothetical protein
MNRAVAIAERLRRGGWEIKRNAPPALGAKSEVFSARAFLINTIYAPNYRPLAAVLPELPIINTLVKPALRRSN